MKLEGLAAFVVTAETGSISAAARRLRVSTSVVSERLSKLEQDVGVALVQRTTRKLTLTEDGARFHPRATSILRDVEAAAADLAEHRGGLAGPLRLSAPLSFGMLHLGPALNDFLLEHPRVELSLELDDRFVDVAGDGYDAVIRIGQVADSRLVAHTLAPSRRVLVASPAYLRDHGRPLSVDDLHRHSAINYTNRGADDWRFVAGTQRVIARVSPRLRVNNGDLMRSAAEAGLGIALLPTFLVGDAIGDGRLHVLDVGAEAEIDTVHIVYPKIRAVPPKVTTLVTALRARFGERPYWDRQFNSQNGSNEAALTTQSRR